MPRASTSRGFTLIELLVVIAIIAVIISILLPSLGGARREAQAIKCSVSAKSIAESVVAYLGSNNDTFPASYVYGQNETGMEWRIEDQRLSNPDPSTGYIHWSYALFNAGFIPEDAFTCPNVTNGGAPRTNPGADGRDWESGQVNDLGGNEGSERPRDRQVRRIAYTGNAAIFPRNKFTSAGGRRLNKFVRGGVVDQTAYGSSKTILVTEFYDSGDGWQSLADLQQDGLGKVKSHRSITPFIGRSAGQDVYNEPDSGSIPRFVYPRLDDLLDDETVRETAGLIAHPNTNLNAVGRTHPQHTANFSFVDGHVERMHVRDSVRDRLWGDRFFSITGKNKVDLDFNSPN